MAERKLGIGLDALLGGARAAEGEEVVQVALGQLRSGPFQPRTEFNEDRLEELAASIRENGVLQPIIVRAAGVAGYEIVAGERRSRAARRAGLGEIPAIIRSYSDHDVLVLGLVENVQRTDLNPIDKAVAYKRLVAHIGITQDEVARRVGLNASSVSNMIRLLDLPEEIQELVRGGALAMGHARALLSVHDELERLKLAERAVKEELSVRAVEELARGKRPSEPKRRSNPRKTPQVAALESEVRALQGTKVSIRDRRGKGRIEIDYYSPQEFERLLGLLRASEPGFGAR